MIKFRLFSHSKDSTTRPAKIILKSRTPENKLSLKAFTLIELLVVIAIIGILSSMLLPSLSSSRRQSQIAVCLNQQKQLSLAITMYSDDYNSFIREKTVFSQTCCFPLVL